MMLAGLWLASAGGCAAPRRPDPAAAFYEICKRSLGDDAAYVRARIAPSFSDPGDVQKSATGSPGFMKGIMRQLRVCRGRSWMKTDHPDKVVVEGVGLSLPGAVSTFSVDLVYDRKVGWQLATPMYDVRRLGSSGGKDEGERMKDDG
jgi:hypothetical protein